MTRGDGAQNALVDIIANPEIYLQKKKGLPPHRGELGQIERHLSEKIHGPRSPKRVPPASPSPALGSTAHLSSTASGQSAPWHQNSISGKSEKLTEASQTQYDYLKQTHGLTGVKHFKQRGFGVGARQPLFMTNDCDFLDKVHPEVVSGQQKVGWKKSDKLGPGSYDGSMTFATTAHWRGDTVTHRQQHYLSDHKSAPLASFPTAPRSKPFAPALGDPLGPGHHSLPNLWDPHLGAKPRRGRTFAPRATAPFLSRFGGFASTAGVT